MEKISIKKFLNSVDERIDKNGGLFKLTVKDYDERSCIINFGNDVSNPIVVKLPSRDGHKCLFDSLKEKFDESILLTSCDAIGYYNATLITASPLVITFDNLTSKGQKWLAKMYKEKLTSR